MKREIFIHFSFFISLFIFMTIFRGWFDLAFWPLWIGGLVGTVLPDIDHLLYMYVRNQELTSLRVNSMLSQRKFSETLSLLAATRSERKNLTFHTIIFQIIFFVLTFWVLTSSGSIFGRGLVIAFLLHLLIDQLIDLLETGNLNSWTWQLPVSIPKERALLYWLALLLVFGVMIFIF